MTAFTRVLALTVSIIVTLPGAGRSQNLSDPGPATPSPGANDIAQLSVVGDQILPDGLNYYTDNQSVHGVGEPGQTFTTGANPAGYLLSSVSLRTAGLNSYDGISTPQAYYLHVYSISGNNATLLQTYTSTNVFFNDGDWLQWSGLSSALEPNANYAWSFGRVDSTAGWEALAVASGNPYAGGEIGLFPPAGGPVTFGSSHTFDAVFDLGLTPAVAPGINQITVSPTNNVPSGTPVSFAAAVTGALPVYCQWLFNGGGGYAEIAGADTNTFVLNAMVTNSGLYELVLSNSYGAVTSAPISLSVTLDTNPPVIAGSLSLGMTTIELDFSKTLNPASAANPANYAFTDGLAITSASLMADNSSVLLTTAPLTYGSNYTLVVNGISDQAVPPNTIAANTLVNLTASPRSRISLDDGWRFELGDPPDVTTNVTYYPEIYDLAKLQSDEVGDVTDTNSETYMESIRIDPIATHAGENVSFAQTNYDDSGWRQLNLPHDWAVELPFNANADGGHGYKPVGSSSFGADNFGWYRHTFTLPASYAGRSLWLEFDGVYRNCLVWLNGHILGRNVSGYESFHFDATPYANPGGTNVLVVRVDASRFEGWFYEGAGIYRHVWLTAENPVHVAEWGTFVATTSLTGSNATLTLQTDITNQSAQAGNGSVTSTVLDANSNVVATVTSPFNIPTSQDLVATQTVALTANLWSPQTPYLYNLITTISNQSGLADVCNTPFGVRVVSFDPAGGVSINGQRVEIQGMCNHQDHAGVGSALPDRLQYYRIERLKELGVNACRTSHNEPTEEFLNACDQLGMLVLDENRRFGTNAEPLSELSREIRRDRNHPAVFAWSIANEEPLQGASTGASMIQVMQDLVHSLDPTRLCTCAMNGSWGSGFSTVIDVQGFNYNLGSMDGFHDSYPEQDSIGTETCSLVSDRGVYTNDTVNGYVWGYDIENGTVSWGETAEDWWSFYDARPWVSGGFCWTGFDYRGEPTPYGWPCINSHFGILDTCGFPKDVSYYYQANWTLKPVLHVFPHWNWPAPGQSLNVWAFGNCQSVELFTNGISLGRQSLNVQSHVEWDNVAYTPGTLQAVGYNNGVAVITNTVVTTGAPSAIALFPDRGTILSDGRDVSVVTVEVLDGQGRVAPTATNLVNFTITGGSIIGAGNGDPGSHEADKASQRSVFNGLAEVIVQSTDQPGSITLTATSAGLAATNIVIATAPALPAPPAPGGVAAVSGNAQVTVSWDIVPGATTYNLWRAATSGGPYTLVAGKIGALNLGYVDGNVANLVTYYYTVTANGVGGTSTDSAEVSATPAPLIDGLSATATNGRIMLSWNGLAGVHYNVKRSAMTGGPYEIIAPSLTGTNYADTSVQSCQEYFYVVTETNGGYESLPSEEVGIVAPGALPPQFTSTDIGAVGLPGSASYCDDQFTLSGSGGDVWGTNDAFQFDYVYVPVSTNCDIRAQILSVQDTSSNAKGAVMIRESPAANSSFAMVDVEPSAGIEFIWRNGTGASAASTVVSGAPPSWVRLTRTNDTFIAYWSADGNTWTRIGMRPEMITMATDAYIGLAVCAHNNEALGTSVIDNLSASFLPAHPAPVLNAVSNQIVNVGQPVALNVSAVDTNVPPLSLTFSLLSGPANATLTQMNNTNAAFNWRPEVANANTTNVVTLEVADNGLPSQSVTQSFQVTVNPWTRPACSSVAIGRGWFTLQINGLNGPDYAVEQSTNLINWTTRLITNSPSMPWIWTDTNLDGLTEQFYRIKAGPPLP